MAARKVTLIAALLLACSPTIADPGVARPPAEATAAPTVKITKRCPQVGDKQTARSERGVRVHVDIMTTDRPVLMDIDNIILSERYEECLAVEAQRCVEMKIGVQRYVTIDNMNGTGQQKKSPVAEKTYLVDLRSGDPTVRSLDGSSVPEDERSVIAAEYTAPMGPKLLESLPQRGLAIGDKPDFGNLLRDSDLRANDIVIQGGKPTFRVLGFRDVRGEPAVFVGMDAVLSLETPGFGHLDGTIKGVLAVRARSGRPAFVTVDGTFEAQSIQGDTPMTVSGKMTMKSWWTDAN